MCVCCVSPCTCYIHRTVLFVEQSAAMWDNEYVTQLSSSWAEQKLRPRVTVQKKNKGLDITERNSDLFFKKRSIMEVRWKCAGSRNRKRAWHNKPWLLSYKRCISARILPWRVFSRKDFSMCPEGCYYCLWAVGGAIFEASAKLKGLSLSPKPVGQIGGCRTRGTWESFCL